VYRRRHRGCFDPSDIDGELDVLPGGVGELRAALCGDLRGAAGD
jgi:hypothetical protein